MHILKTQHTKDQLRLLSLNTWATGKKKHIEMLLTLSATHDKTRYPNNLILIPQKTQLFIIFIKAKYTSNYLFPKVKLKQTLIFFSMDSERMSLIKIPIRMPIIFTDSSLILLQLNGFATHSNI